MKKIGESKRIMVGWGRSEGRICYFLSHKTLKNPIPCNPEHLQNKMKALADLIDGGKPKKKRR
ncbi:MAG: hypothetical protein PHT31_06990 [Candidatus Omnitrophica bacterium]|nr:hypothetical protein [Candidatus Omnitrophota bacterium]